MIDEYKELESSIEDLLKILEEYGLEINEYGELVDKKTKKLVIGDYDEKK